VNTLGGLSVGSTSRLAVVGFDRDATSLERSRHIVIGRDALRFVAAVPVHSAAPISAASAGHDARRRPAPQHKAIALFLQLLIKRAQRAGQPPACRAPERAGAFVVEDIEAKQRSAGARSLRQRRMIGDAQVVAKPDNDGSALIRAKMPLRVCLHTPRYRC
jgi:hypothetical protein